MRYYGCKTKLLDFLSEAVAKTRMRAYNIGLYL
mgnify:CR=1 FL=1